MASQQARVVRIENHAGAWDDFWADPVLFNEIKQVTEKIRDRAEAETPEPYYARNMKTLYERAGTARTKRPVGFVRSSGWHSQEYEARHRTLSRAVRDVG